MTNEREQMLEQLRANGITSERVLHAMAIVPRENFVRPQDRADAYADRALPIDYGQTISQPLMVAILIQALDLRDGDNVLDVGTGSGYQAAVIAACDARVVSIERIPELAASAAERLRTLGYDVDVRTGDGGLGAPDRAPFDAIAVAAVAPELPVTLTRQLAVDGRLVVPIRRDTTDVDELVRLRNSASGSVTENLGPCRFVPLIGHDGYSA